MNKFLTTTTFLFTLIIAQNTSYKFDYFDISDGLSQNRAQVIYQARDGYIYVGSQGGLDRFDGYNFKYFSHNPSDSTSVPFGWVSAISEDSKNNLWVGTTQKTIGYLKPNGLWTRVKLKAMENWDRDGRSWWWGFISDIKPYKDKVLISSNGNGLFIIDNEEQEHYTTDIDGANIVSEIKVINERIFLATRGGVFEFDINKKEFLQTSISLPVGGFSNNNNDKFYISTDKEIFLYDFKNDSYENIKINVNKNDRSFRKIAFYNNRLWILNESYGIVIHDLKNKSSIQLSPPAIKDTEHFSMTLDRDNAIWIGTSSYGMMKYDPGKQKFKLYSKDFPSSNPLGYDVGWGATIDRNGNYWTGKAEAYGEIVKIDRKSGKIKRYLQDDDPRSWFWNFRKTNDGMLVWKGYPGRSENFWYKYAYDTDKFTEIDFFNSLYNIS